jgi:hypothetical protein
MCDSFRARSLACRRLPIIGILLGKLPQTRAKGRKREIIGAPEPLSRPRNTHTTSHSPTTLRRRVPSLFAFAGFRSHGSARSARPLQQARLRARRANEVRTIGPKAHPPRRVIGAEPLQRRRRDSMPHDSWMRSGSTFSPPRSARQ